MNDGILKCKASNTIGSNTDQIRLNVQCKFELYNLCKLYSSLWCLKYGQYILNNRKINVINKLYRTFHLVIETWLVCQPQDSSDPNQVLVLQQYKQACVIRPHLFCS